MYIYKYIYVDLLLLLLGGSLFPKKFPCCQNTDFTLFTPDSQRALSHGAVADCELLLAKPPVATCARCCCSPWLANSWFEPLMRTPRWSCALLQHFDTYMYIYVKRCTHIHVHIHMHAYAYTYTNKYTYTCTYTYTYTCTYTCKHTYTCTHTCTYTYINMHRCSYMFPNFGSARCCSILQKK